MKEKIMSSKWIQWIVNLKICQLLAKNKVIGKFCNYEMISYIIVGVLTTVVNYVTYFVMRAYDADPLLANTVAWVFAVIFAFFANKIFVFDSPSWSLSTLWKEFIPFIICRLLSFAFDTGFIAVTVKLWHWNEPIAKILDNVFVLLANYFASKFLIFKKPVEKQVASTSTENQTLTSSEGTNKEN